MTPSPSPNTGWPSLTKKEQPNTGSPPSPSLFPNSRCPPGLFCCDLAWPWMSWDVPGLELETWHNSLARRGQMKGNNRRVTGRLHMYRLANGEGRGGGQEVKGKRSTPCIPGSCTDCSLTDEQTKEMRRGFWMTWGAWTPATPPNQQEGGRTGGLDAQADALCKHT